MRVISTLIAAASAATIIAQGTDAGSGPLSVSARAGIGGLVRAGRWTPVIVEIDRRSRAPEDGVLTVSWGDAQVRHQLELPATIRRRVTLYVRTSEPQDAVHVRLDTASGGAATAIATVTPVAIDARLTLCVAPDGERIPGPGCSVIVSPADLPSAVLGYDAVDDVTWLPGGQPSGNQAQVLEEWRAWRASDEYGDLSLTGQPPRPETRRGLASATATPLLTGAAVYLTALGAIGWAAVTRRLPLGAGSAAAAALAIVAGSAASMLGHLGPARAVHVRQTALLQQLPGTTASLLTMRAVADFPAFDRFELRLPLTDAAIEASTPSERAAQERDRGGYPILTGTFGLARRQAFSAEALTHTQPLDIAIDDGSIAVTNAGRLPLEECRFGSGFSTEQIGHLEPGAMARAEMPADHLGPAITCTLRAPVVAFDAAARPVVTSGSTIVAAYVPRQRQAPPAEAEARE